MRSLVAFSVFFTSIFCVLIGSGEDAEAGKGWRLFGRCCRQDECRECGNECRCQEEEEDDDDRCCCGPPPPAGPIVSSIPALMLAQPAVPVSPLRLDAALRQQYGQNERAKYLKHILDAIEARARANAAAPQPSANIRQPRANLSHEQRELEQLRQQVKDLTKLTKQLTDLVELEVDAIERDK